MQDPRGQGRQISESARGFPRLHSSAADALLPHPFTPACALPPPTPTALLGGSQTALAFVSMQDTGICNSALSQPT